MIDSEPVVNPYSLTEHLQRRDVSNDTLRQARFLARDLAGGGAVLGSITRKLQSLGLDLPLATRIATDALFARSRRRRAWGGCMIAVGIAVAVAGYWIPGNLWFGRLRVYVAMSGAFLVMLGSVELMHRTPVSRATRVDASSKPPRAQHFR